MDISLAAYYDRNFGDDMMVRLAANALEEHRLYMEQAREEFLAPFSGIENLYPYAAGSGVAKDGQIRVTGSYFMIRRRYLPDLNYMYQRGRMEKKRRETMKFSYVIGCNVGPFANRLAEKISIAEMKAYDLLTFRDRYSYEFAKAHVKGAQLYYFPDIVFSTPQRWLAPPTGEGLLGVVVHTNIIETKNNSALAKSLALLCDEYTSRTGKKVLLFVFDIGVEDDILCACNVRLHSKHPEMLELVLHDDCGGNIIRNMARCGTVVSARLHGMVMALRMGIPLLPVLYSDKAKHLLSDIGYLEKAYSVSEFVELPAKELCDKLMKIAPYFVPEQIVQEAEKHFEVARRHMAEI